MLGEQTLIQASCEQWEITAAISASGGRCIHGTVGALSGAPASDLCVCEGSRGWQEGFPEVVGWELRTSRKYLGLQQGRATFRWEEFLFVGTFFFFKSTRG